MSDEDSAEKMPDRVGLYLTEDSIWPEVGGGLAALGGIYYAIVDGDVLLGGLSLALLLAVYTILMLRKQNRHLRSRLED